MGEQKARRLIAWVAFAIVLAITFAMAPAISAAWSAPGAESSRAPLQLLAFGLVLAAFVLSMARGRLPD
jgi:hypothetical protein